MNFLKHGSLVLEVSFLCCFAARSLHRGFMIIKSNELAFASVFRSYRHSGFLLNIEIGGSCCLLLLINWLQGWHSGSALSVRSNLSNQRRICLQVTNVSVLSSSYELGCSFPVRHCFLPALCFQL